MKEFFKEILIEPFVDSSIADKILGVVIWLLTLFLVTVISVATVYLVDMAFLSKKQATGTITNKYIVPDHYTTSIIMAGKVSVPVTTHHDTEYYVRIDIDEMSDDVAITPEYFLIAQEGDSVNCTYSNGRLFKTLYIKSIQ